MLDEYIIGQHHRNSPEAVDVPVITAKNREARLGGAANVALNINTLGLKPILISVVGNDKHGLEVKSLLTEAEIHSHLITDNDRPTTVKQRIVDQSFRQYLRIDTESTEDLDSRILVQIENQIKETLLHSDIAALVIQDYNKGVITENLIKQIQQLSIKNNIPLFVDPKDKNFNLLSESCAVFKPNIKELSKEIGYEVSPDSASIREALAKLDTLGAEKIFITLGDKGIFYSDRSLTNHGIIKGIAVEKADVSGAGDTVLATLIWSFLQGANLPTMATQANHAAAQVCKVKGVSAMFNI